MKAREAGIYTNGRLRTRAAAPSESPASADSDGAEPAQGRDADTLTRLTQTITELKGGVKQQSASIIEVHGELGRVRTDQELLKCQNAELQEEIRALRTQVGALSVSAPSTRSWASVAAITDASQLSSRSNISLARTADSTGTKTEQNVVRISTQAEQSAAGSSNLRKIRCSSKSENAYFHTVGHYHAHTVGKVVIYPSFTVLALVVSNEAKDLPVHLVSGMIHQHITGMGADIIFSF